MVTDLPNFGEFCGYQQRRQRSCPRWLVSTCLAASSIVRPLSTFLDERESLSCTNVAGIQTFKEEAARIPIYLRFDDRYFRQSGGDDLHCHTGSFSTCIKYWP